MYNAPQVFGAVLDKKHLNTRKKIIVNWMFCNWKYNYFRN